MRSVLKVDKLYHVHVPTAKKFESLNFLETSGPVIVLHRNCFASTYALHV